MHAEDNNKAHRKQIFGRQ